MKLNENVDDISYIAKILNKKWIKGFKQLGNNPKALTKSVYIDNVLPNIDNYFMTDKADGLRSFLMISDLQIKSITSEDVNYIHVENTFKSEYIFDCELVKDILYIFDVIMYNGINVSNEHFSKRYEKLQDFEKILDKSPLSKQVKVKTFYKLNFKNYQNQIMDLYKYKSKLPYQIDGLIFIEMTHDYNSTSNLKWKPAEMLTIDFLALHYKDDYILANGIKTSMMEQFRLQPNSKFKELIGSLDIKESADYAPVPFYNSLKPNIYIFNTSNFNTEKVTGDLHGHVIELSYDIKLKKWVFHKIRYDRDVELKNGTYYGNNYKVAETTLQSILNPLSFKDLMMSYTSLTSDRYFKKQDSTYKSIKLFNNYVKRILIRQYKADDVIDLASGRGGDLKKYDVKNLLMLEYDIEAIDEIINRKYNNAESKNSDHSKNTNLIVLQADLNNDYKKTIKLIDENFVDASVFVNNQFIPRENSIKSIFCHFAMHYFMESEASAKNIVSLISHYLAVNGAFVMTIFDGESVFELLRQNKGKWSPNKKYMISTLGRHTQTTQSHIKQNIFAGFGHEIEVLLPLADKPYKEPLIDIVALDRLFKLHNIYRTSDRNFGDMLPEYKNNNIQVFDESDVQFISLYKYVVYTKNK